MASTFASYFGQRSTIAYTTAGAVPAGSMYTVSSNVGPTWTNTLTVSSFSTLSGSTITVSTLRYNSTTVSLGQSTNQSYTTLGNGSYTVTNWINSLGSLTSTTKVAINQNASNILIGHANSSTINTTVNTGVTWSSLTGTNGLPAGATAYPLTTASGTPNYTSISQSATGQYVLASVNGGLLYESVNSGATFTAIGMGAPYIYQPFDGSYSDVMGNSTVVPTGSPAFVTGVVGSQAVNFANTVGAQGTKYIRVPWTGASNFTISFWFNAQTINGLQQDIVTGDQGSLCIFITPTTNYLSFYVPNNGTSITIATSTTAIVVNTWYNVTAIFQTNGLCSLYINNVLVGSGTQTSGLSGTTLSYVSLGTYSTSTQAFNGYVDDFRIYNSAVTFSPIIPMNWTSTAMSSTGQYQLASATTGGLFLSSNYGATWTMITSVGGWGTIAMSASGQYMFGCSTTATYDPYYSTNYGATWTNSTFEGLTGSFAALSGNGQYSITGYTTTARIVSNYLAGYTTTVYSTPTLTSINANIVAAAISGTGQYMVIVTQGTTNNVYYSTNYGSTFSGTTIGALGMTSCAISYDGSYIVVSSPTIVYILNLNSAGYSVALGTAAGVANQGQNAIAIGNAAGQTNQTAGSIVLNGTGSALNAYVPGFFVAPVATIASSASNLVSLLAYGSDSQIIQTGLNYNISYGLSLAPVTTVTYTQSSILGFNYGGGSAGTQNSFRILSQVVNRDAGAGPYYDYGAQADLVFQRKTNNLYSNGANDITYTEVMRLGGATGFVGIGTTSPQASLHVQGNTLITNPTIYNLVSAAWYIIGYWDCTAAPSMGARLKVRLMGCNGYGAPSTNGSVSGGETTIYLTNLNNYNATVVNIDGVWKHEGGTPPITSVKVVQNGSSRYQYYVYAYVQSYTQHAISAETTQGTIWTTQFTSASDPGSNSSTVQLITMSTVSIGANVGIGTANPGAALQINDNSTTAASYPFMIYTPNLSAGGSQYLYFGTANSTNNVAQLGFCNVGIGSTSNYAFLQIYGKANIMTWQASSGNVGIGTATPGGTLHIHNATADYTNSLIVNTAWPSIRLGNGSTGRDWSILNGGTGAGIGVGNFGIYDVTSLAYRFCINSSGYVGIGTQTPTYPLHIGSAPNASYTLTGYIGSGGVGAYGGGTINNNATSIYIVGWGMTQAAWGVTSDRRIKTNIEPVYNMLSIIDQVNVVKYDYIDPRMGHEACSIIAQELQMLFPNAINVTTDYVTNIFKPCTHVLDNGIVTLSVTFSSTPDINVGSILKIMLSDDDGKTEKEITTPILSVADNTITIAEWDNYMDRTTVFVYGTQVGDFLSIDKPQLGVMALQGVKELHQIIQQQQSTITTLQTQLNQMMTRLSAAGL